MALQFLKHRRPTSKSHHIRLPHMVTYLLEELPVFLTGIMHKNVKHQTMVYPTAAAQSSFGLAKTVYEVQTLPEFANLREEIYHSSSTVSTHGLVVLPINIPENQSRKKREANTQADAKQVKIGKPHMEPSITELIKPTFLHGSTPANLLSNGAMVGINVLPNSPLLSRSGSWQLVSFLASLPNPSLIVIEDLLNRHVISALRNMRKFRVMSEETAVKIAMKSTKEYFNYLYDALHYLEKTQPWQVGKVTILGWADIETPEIKQHQEIVRRYYSNDKSLKEKIGMYLEKYTVN